MDRSRPSPEDPVAFSPPPPSQIIKQQDPNIIVTVDNCYGEFTSDLEPCAAGADLCMGSLIKNGGVRGRAGGGCFHACMPRAGLFL